MKHEEQAKLAGAIAVMLRRLYSPAAAIAIAGTALMTLVCETNAEDRSQLVADVKKAIDRSVNVVDQAAERRVH
jgi:hypothetical protein